jgi:hypothetical protein
MELLEIIYPAPFTTCMFQFDAESRIAVKLFVDGAVCSASR